MVGAAGATFGVMTRGAPEVWPVVVPAVELLVVAVGELLELLTAVRLSPHEPNSIKPPTIATAPIIAAIVPVPIPVPFRTYGFQGLFGHRVFGC